MQSHVSRVGHAGRRGLYTLAFFAAGGIALAIVNGDFETPAGAAPVPGWVELGGVVQGGPEAAGGAGPGANSARFTDGPGIPLLGGAARGAGIAQTFWCGDTDPMPNCYIKFTYAFDDVLPNGASAFVSINGPAGRMRADIPDNDLTSQERQVAYPECGQVTLVFGVVEPGGALTSVFYLDMVEDKCDSAPFPGIPELPLSPVVPTPTSSQDELTFRLENTGAHGNDELLLFGSSCAGESGTVPTIGTTGFAETGELFSIDITGPPSTPGFLIAGASNTVSILGPLPAPLDLLGVPGCFLNVSNDLMLPFTTDANGDAGFVVAGFTAGNTGFAQAFVLDFGLSTLGSLTEGLAVTGLAPSGNVGGEVVITEFMKDPTFVTDGNGEWVELHNPGGSAVDIEGWILCDSDFDSTVLDNGGAGIVIPAGGYIVVGTNADSSTNGNVNVAYEYAQNGQFFLSNASDEIFLVDETGDLIDKVEYDDGVLWPDTPGMSIELLVSAIDPCLNDDGSNWMHSTCTIEGMPCNDDTGTPNLQNDMCNTMPCPPPPMGEQGDVIVTEFMKDPNGGGTVNDSQGEWLELFNTTNADIDIEGWTLTDDGANSHTINVGGAGLTVPMGGRIVLGNNMDMATNGGVVVAYEYSNYFLGNSDDEIILTDDLGQPQDEVKYDNGVLWPDTSGMSISFDPNVSQDATTNNDPANWCHSTSTIPSGDTGTPNAGNDNCPPPGP